MHRVVTPVMLDAGWMSGRHTSWVIRPGRADWAEVGGAAAQLGVNLVALVLGGLARLAVQRRAYDVRLERHSSSSAR